MLEALTTSLGAGKNVPDSFRSVYDDLSVQYDDGAEILQELEIIMSGISHNVDIEDLLMDFGVRSGIEDISSFANVFKICYRKGGNIKDTIRNTHNILSDKMEITEDIETIVTANKTEQNIMIVMPIGLIGMIKLMSADFAANFVTPAGIIATTIGVVLFVAAYFVGKAVLDIKV
jgi:tight adherence protein B